MKFAHLADIHLGYEQYNQSWRAEDFTAAFKSAAMQIVEEAVDFVIIAGDLFHRSVPNPRTIKDAIEVLAKFKDAGIPVFAIEGNHDKSVRDISAYHLLESLGLLNVLGLRRKKVEGENVVSEKVGNVYLVKGIFDSIEIIGDRHRTKWQLEKVLPILKPESDESIVVLHQAVKEVVDIDLDMAYDVTLADLPKASYYAFGHVHMQKIYRFGESYVVYPGSLERYDLREASCFVEVVEDVVKRNGIEKGYVIVEDFQPRAVKVNVRELVSLNVEGLSKEEVEKKFVSALRLVPSESVLIARIKCGEDVDIRRLHEFASKSAKYAEIRFERIREEVKAMEVTSEHEFFDEFEMKLLELLKEDSDAYRSSAYDLIKEHFGLAEVRRLQDYSVDEAEVEKEAAVIEERKKEESGVKKPKTLLDFFGGGT